MSTTIENLKKRLKKLNETYQRSDVNYKARDEENEVHEQEYTANAFTGGRAHRPPPPKVDACAGSEFM